MNIGSSDLLIILIFGSLFCTLKKIIEMNRDQIGTAINAIKNKKKFPLLTNIAIIMVILLLITSSGCTTKEPSTIINNNATQVSVEKTSNSPIASEQTATKAIAEEGVSEEEGISEEETQSITRTTKPDIEIIHPVKYTEWQENIGGIAKNIPDGDEFWILVYSQEKQQYYPYAKITPQYDEWVIPVTIGFEDDHGENFDIVAVLADNKAQDRFDTYLVTKEENEENIYSQGIYQIPEGAKEYSRVTLTRRW